MAGAQSGHATCADYNLSCRSWEHGSILNVFIRGYDFTAETPSAKPELLIPEIEWKLFCSAFFASLR